MAASTGKCLPRVVFRVLLRSRSSRPRKGTLDHRPLHPGGQRISAEVKILSSFCTLGKTGEFRLLDVIDELFAGVRDWWVSQAGFSALPHSRQQVSKRGVMSPQNGHIRCDVKSPSRGPIPNNFLPDAATKARKRRTPARNACRSVRTAETSRFSNRSRTRQAQETVRVGKITLAA